MSDIASIILSFVLTLSATITGLVPGNNPSDIAKETGRTVSELAQSDATASAPLYFGNEATPSAHSENFGAWVSSMTPDEPKEDGKVFGEIVSTAASSKSDEDTQNEDSNESENNNPEVEIPDPADPPQNTDPCDSILLHEVQIKSGKTLLPKSPCIQ